MKNEQWNLKSYFGRVCAIIRPKTARQLVREHEFYFYDAYKRGIDPKEAVRGFNNYLDSMVKQ